MNQDTFHDAEGDFIVGRDAHGHEMKLYLPKEAPMQGAITTYGAKIFQYDATDGVWTEKRQESYDE